MAIDFKNLDNAIAQHFGDRIEALQEQLLETVPDKLKSSQTDPVYSNEGKTAMITWEHPEALLIHEGFTERNGTVYPPERWTETAIALVTDG